MYSTNGALIKRAARPSEAEINHNDVPGHVGRQRVDAIVAEVRHNAVVMDSQIERPQPHDKVAVDGTGHVRSGFALAPVPQKAVHGNKHPDDKVAVEGKGDMLK
ncbi:unnamed protein product [Oppiella nova]|uniref:Uncharacterized protein n=1 Tax=Oppiella nova TaxID=334625 RepID=A0A7R9LQB5_9ACAR|nr:unnamed protein product [Oppiella nova]CAG2165295.1 unnamed protein product [Oppiella nova]